LRSTAITGLGSARPVTSSTVANITTPGIRRIVATPLMLEPYLGSSV
jgi:hypothetical protein